MSDVRSLASWLLRVAQPPTAGSDRCRSAGARQHPALFCARAWHLRHAPHQASVSAGGAAGQSSPHRARAGPGGLRGKTRRQCKAPWVSEPAQTIAPNQLKRELTGQVPDTAYVGDITYLPPGEGWLYMAVVLDLCSRAVVGWSMAHHMRAELVHQALAM